MFGRNPKRPPETGDGSILKIVEIFPTLQGEGPFVGYPAVFVRLGGCNLACDFCDTEFEAFEAMRLDSVIENIDSFARESGKPSPFAGEGLDEGASSGADHLHSPSPLAALDPLPQGERVAPVARSQAYLRDLVVITGGEPLRQNIGPLCEALLARGLRVQIETNGTLWRPLPEGVNVVCSPKVTDGRYHPLRPDLLDRVDALKFIVSAQAGPYHAVGEVGQEGRNIPLYVQPMDQYDPLENAANTAHALALAQQYGYRLSLQMHKQWGIA